MYFIFKNTNSSSKTGLIVTSLPPVTKPPKRTETIDIEGRDGDIVIEHGYEAYDKKIEIGLTRGYNIDDIISWLDGSGDLIMSNESDKVYKARIIKQIDFERLLVFKTASVTFHVQPYKYKYDEDDVSATSSQISSKSMTVTNRGNVSSKPLIRLTGSGTVTFKLNGADLFTYTFPSEDSYVDIDSEEQDAYVSSTLKNRNMNGSFPVLNVGSNTISWTGTLTTVKVTPRSRWL